MKPWISPEGTNRPRPLSVFKFTSDECPIRLLKETLQTQYLLRYLSGLKCRTVIYEPNYFDNDYLSEFSEFYGTSAKGYPNTCGRLHFFSREFTERDLESALSQKKDMVEKLETSFLGFTVIRPIPCAPLGRTVLAWFDDRPDVPQRQRVLRNYHVHIAGLRLTVRGLAWQQQDTGVGACATIALWTALHSSANDDGHSIPTTSEITRAAHKTASLGDRVFPSGGLTAEQLLEAIKEINLSPAIEEGRQKERRFSRERFGALCWTFINSGHPIILIGQVKGSPTRRLHAVCVVGYREVPSKNVKPGSVESKGQRIEVLYINDDNLGPNVRFELVTFPSTEKGESPYVAIRPKAPPKELYWPAEDNSLDPTDRYWTLIPEAMAIPMHQRIRTSPSTIGNYAQRIGQWICGTFNAVSATGDIGISAGSTFFLQKDYLGRILADTLKKEPDNVLGKVRTEFFKKVQPLGLFVGVVRVWHEDRPLFDVIFDTTDSDRNMAATSYVTYDQAMHELLEKAVKKPSFSKITKLTSLGPGICAFSPQPTTAQGPSSK